MKLSDAVALTDYVWACACVGRQNRQPLCPCRMTWREIDELKRAAHIVARQLDDLRRRRATTDSTGKAS